MIGESMLSLLTTSFASRNTCGNIDVWLLLTSNTSKQPLNISINESFLLTVQQQSRYRLSNIILDVQHEFNVEITYFKIFHVKEFTFEIIYDTHEDMYKVMSKYFINIEEINSNNIIRLDITTENQFQHIFICYDVCVIDLVIVVLFLNLMILTSRHDIKT